MNPSFIGTVAAGIFLLLGGVVGGLIGNIFNYLTLGVLCGLIISSGFYILIGINMVPEREARVIQRFGKQYRTLDKPGLYLLCFPGIIDHEFARFPINQDISLDLYQDSDEKAVVEFSNAQARIVARAWIRITEPEIYAYEISNPTRYIEGLFDNYVRARLAQRTIDDALKEKDVIAKEAREIINKVLKRAGAELVDLFIENLILSPETAELRRRRLKGQTAAEEIQKESDGWLQTIKTIAEGLILKGVEPEKAIQEAIKMFREQSTLGAIQLTQANVTLIADGVRGMLGIFAGKK